MHSIIIQQLKDLKQLHETDTGRKIEFAIWFANKANLAIAEFATIAKVAIAEFAHSHTANLEFAIYQIFQKY